MKLEPWEPDLRSLRDRVAEGSLDLQPDFQRGNVWSTVKRQKLIDSVLRGWAIPPLHLLVLKDRSLAVLDGQQRLRALTEFLNDSFPIGEFAPADDRVRELKGLRFSFLPIEVQREILDFKVPSYRLYEYAAAEPYELFFRLNQPTGLTQAEKRNSLVGEARAQIKELVTLAQEAGWSKDTLGFENSRLAYDDIIARTCELVESNDLNMPVSASTIEKRYRSRSGFTDVTLSIAKRVVTHAAINSPRKANPAIRLNKATLLSWMLAEARRITNPALNHFDTDTAFGALEAQRTTHAGLTPFDGADVIAGLWSDRSSLRVGDTLSVVSRDLCVWLWAGLIQPSESQPRSAEENILDLVIKDYKQAAHDGILDEDYLLRMFANRPTWTVLR